MYRSSSIIYFDIDFSKKWFSLKKMGLALAVILSLVLPIKKSQAADLEDFLSIVEGSEYFSAMEKTLTRDIVQGASEDDSFLDAVMSSPLISAKEKEMARAYFQTRKKPTKLRYKDPQDMNRIEVLAPAMRFHADLDMRIRSIDTAKDVSAYFPIDNADFDPGVAHILQGSIHYRPEEEKDPQIWGRIDLDIQSLDQEEEVINVLMVRKGDSLKVGSFLSPEFSEFGLRNSEIAGAQIQLRRRKWVLDFARGDTVEDFVPSLDSLSVGGGILRREIGHKGKDFIGLSLYDHNRFHYAGFLAQGYLFDESLRFYGEYMHRDSGIVGKSGSAGELEVDFQNKKIIFLNELQRISSNFSSELNPEFSQFGSILSRRNRQEHGFTYRFDPFITSSVIFTRRSNLFVDGTPEVKTSDLTMALITQRPERPKYMVVFKHQERNDEFQSILDERRRIVLAQTTFRGRDILTSVDVAQTDFENFRSPRDSYLLNSFSLDISRPFLKKIRIREKLGILDQNFEDGTQDSEAQTHQFEVRYTMDSRNSLRGIQKYRRVARRAGPNKYKTIYALEARHRRGENLEYTLRLDSFNNNEFSRGYDANRISMGANLSF